MKKYVLITAVFLLISSPSYAANNKIEVVAVNKISKPKGKTLAFVDIILDDSIKIRGLKVINGANGIFVAYPSERSKEGDYYNLVIIKDQDLKDKISELVLNKYK